MPCLPGERFLLLERSVAVGQAGSKEVDALVAKLGEVLQLSAQRAPAPRGPKHPQPASARGRVAPYAPRGSGFLAPAPLQPHQPVEPQRPGKASQRVAKQLCGRGWLRSASRRRKRPGHGEAAGEEEDPHRLLQQLILSGNLIKEAVRRLQLAAAAVATATTGGSGEGEAATLQPLQ
ncbi:GSK-3-binding protein-like [Pelodiscus sinensis]|uniref:GSK-3-binding protein-like n=1 Tax=Pelodiscus sinensis TaxID=13735 RepID=UPI003F6D8A00